MPRIKVAGELIYFEDRGKADAGITFLLIHGVAGASIQWLELAEHLEEEHRVIALDLPGHGSSTGRGGRSVESYLKAVRSFTEALHLTPTILCGYSMGGAIAMEYALKYPEDVFALGLISTGARLKVSPLFLEICLEKDMEKLKILLGKYAFAPSVSLIQIQKWYKKWGLPASEVIYGDFLACNSFDLMEGVEKIKTPALVVCGDEDRMTPVKYSEFLASKMENSSLHIIEGGGHMLMVEKPLELSAALADFAKTLMNDRDSES
jgi:pimeloyl-ACP methyl ester carboxylesterase